MPEINKTNEYRTCQENLQEIDVLVDQMSWEYDTKTDLMDKGFGNVNWSELAQDMF